MPSSAIAMATRQKRAAITIRRLKNPPSPSRLRVKTTASQGLRRAGADCEVDFVFIAEFGFRGVLFDFR